MHALNCGSSSAAGGRGVEKVAIAAGAPAASVDMIN